MHLFIFIKRMILMSKKKVSKNNPTNKKSEKKLVLALSSDCEVCITQCEKGLKYIEQLKSGKSGNGVVCKK
jgi:hypothetical protein